MLTSDTNPPEVAPSNRREMLRYMERFNRWARRLTDEDLGMVVAFCANVQMAWTDGQKTATDPAAQVAEGTAPIELPGLGAPLEQVVSEGSRGACEVKLPKGVSVTIADLPEDK